MTGLTNRKKKAFQTYKQCLKSCNFFVRESIQFCTLITTELITTELTSVLTESFMTHHTQISTKNTNTHERRDQKLKLI